MASSNTGAVGGWRRIKAAYLLRPMVISVSGLMVPLGLAVILLGERASRAFTVLGGDSPAKLIGVAMLIGGTLLLAGTFAASTFMELIGASFAATGLIIYSGGCYLGLGINGVISGTLAASVAIGFVGRILYGANAARSAVATPLSE